MIVLAADRPRQLRWSSLGVRSARGGRGKAVLFLPPEEVVPVYHLADPFANVRIQLRKMTLENWKQFLAERFASDHPLEVVPAAMVVGAVKPGARDLRSQPVKELTVPHMHPQGYLRVEAVAAEVALSNEDSNEKALLVVSHTSILSGRCFTVKFPVKHPRIFGTHT